MSCQTFSFHMLETQEDTQNDTLISHKTLVAHTFSACIMLLNTWKERAVTAARSLKKTSYTCCDFTLNRTAIGELLGTEAVRKFCSLSRLHDQQIHLWLVAECLCFPKNWPKKDPSLQIKGIQRLFRKGRTLRPRTGPHNMSTATGSHFRSKRFETKQNQLLSLGSVWDQFEVCKNIHLCLDNFKPHDKHSYFRSVWGDRDINIKSAQKQTVKNKYQHNQQIEKQNTYPS